MQKLKFRPFLFLVVTGFLLFFISGRSAAFFNLFQLQPDSLTGNIQNLLSVNPAAETKIQNVVENAYLESEYHPFWIIDDKVSSSGQRLIELLGQSALDGLAPQAYSLKEIESLWRSPILSKSDLARLDVLLTFSFFKFVSDIRLGRIVPGTVDKEWFVTDKEKEAEVDDLLYALTPETLQNFIDSQYPADIGYDRLKGALVWLKSVQSGGGWPVLSPDFDFCLLRKRLIISGDLARPGSSACPNVFGPDIRSALERFQLRHGLESSGVLTEDTIQELNVLVEKRILQIEANLERWRWLPHERDLKYVLINVPDYKLSVIEYNRPVFSTNIIVGRTDRRTPSFDSRIIAVEINPQWVVPQSIARLDLFPEVRKNPLVQDSGPMNPLGKIKFWIPNPFGILMHDTSSPELFKKNVRAFSSGCIRVEMAAQLANYLLKNTTQRDILKFETEVRSGTNSSFVVKPSLPVYVVYRTAWVDTNGIIQFRPDIYGRDTALENALTDKPTDVLSRSD